MTKKQKHVASTTTATFRLIPKALQLTTKVIPTVVTLMLSLRPTPRTCLGIHTILV